MAWRIVLVAAVVSGGCLTGRSPRPFHDPSFTGTAACEGGIAVAGIVSIVGNPLERTRLRDDFAEILVDVLRDRLEGCSIRGPKEVRGLIGDDRHDSLLRSYEADGSAGPEVIAGLKEALAARCRYAVMARVTGRQFEHGRRPLTGAADSPVVIITSGKLAMDFVVHDYSTDKAVWIGRTTGSAEATELEGGSGGPYPDPPGWRGLVSDCCRRFVKDILRESR